MIVSDVYQDDSADFDESGEDLDGRELVAARTAADGQYLLYELGGGGYLAVPASVEVVTAVTVDKLMARVGILYDLDAPSPPGRYQEIGVIRDPAGDEAPGDVRP